MNEKRIKGCFLGLVVGDALCMPVHWYYNKERLLKDYGELKGMVAPKKTHPESLVSGMSYSGKLNILHDKAPYYEKQDQSKMSQEEIEAKTDTHNIFVERREEERPHYHGSLKKGQNTLNICTARLLSRYLSEVCVNRRDGYCPLQFLEKWKDYMLTTPTEDDVAQLKAHNDLYTDIYLRYFFEQASLGVELTRCAHNQRDIWSIGALDGVTMTIPLILAYINDPEAMLVGRAVEHHMLTHRSVTVTMGVVVIVPLLQKLINGSDFNVTVDEAMEKMKPPKINGREMADSYMRTKGGPFGISKPEKWRQHMEIAEGEVSLKELIRGFVENGATVDDVAGWLSGKARFATACYVEHSLAIVLYLACKYQNDFSSALTANAKLGGHTAARGALLGAILGAAFGEDIIPNDWINDLAAPSQIQEEATNLAKVALN